MAQIGISDEIVKGRGKVMHCECEIGKVRVDEAGGVEEDPGFTTKCQCPVAARRLPGGYRAATGRRGRRRRRPGEGCRRRGRRLGSCSRRPERVQAAAAAWAFAPFGSGVVPPTTDPELPGRVLPLPTRRASPAPAGWLSVPRTAVKCLGITLAGAHQLPRQSPLRRRYPHLRPLRMLSHCESQGHNAIVVN
jgi:hypothetical protein